MRTPVRLDDVDRRIIDLLVEDGRRSIASIAKTVRLSAAPVQRRITRLERAGVIRGYKAVVDQGVVDGRFEAFTELRYSGETDVESITSSLKAIPEVLEVFTVAGDPDSIARIRVDSVAHLQQVVDGIRRSKNVLGTKTLIVLESWSRSETGEPHSRGEEGHSGSRT